MQSPHSPRSSRSASPRLMLVLAFLASVAYVAYDKWREESRATRSPASVSSAKSAGESTEDSTETSAKESPAKSTSTTTESDAAEATGAVKSAESSDVERSSRPPAAQPSKAKGPGRDKSPNGNRDDTNRSDRVIVRQMTIRNQAGQVVYQGDIDLTETLRRIDRGERLSFPNDGTTFRNRERRLPRQPADHYREWVHPTPRLSGPGPQRVVTGRTGEAYYTPDHYETFHEVRPASGRAPVADGRF